MDSRRFEACLLESFALSPLFSSERRRGCPYHQELYFCPVGDSNTLPPFIRYCTCTVHTLTLLNEGRVETLKSFLWSLRISSEFIRILYRSIEVRPAFEYIPVGFILSYKPRSILKSNVKLEIKSFKFVKAQKEYAKNCFIITNSQGIKI